MRLRKLFALLTAALMLTPCGVMSDYRASPPGRLDPVPGVADAGCAPLKFQNGTLNTTPEAGAVEYYQDTKGHFYATPADAVTVTGGAITYANGFTIHTFIASGTNFAVSGGILLGVNMFIVGGGAGGGSNAGGGGGAGSVWFLENQSLAAGNYAVVTGDGGAGGTYPGAGTNGASSYISSVSGCVADGGGGGGYAEGAGHKGVDGGCGGGGGPAIPPPSTIDGGVSTAVYPSATGYKGGAGVSSSSGGNHYAGGGGGGSGGVGNDANAGATTAGNGGLGTTCAANGVTYAGGGGGGCYLGSTPGTGTDGGGNGGGNEVAGTDATVAGSGGGAGGGNAAAGGKGFRGKVIIYYPTDNAAGRQEIVLTGATQTIMNKTITAPTITGASIATSTLTTPTIASFTNAAHNHSNAAGGGNLGVVTATSINKYTFTAPASAATVTVANNSTLGIGGNFGVGHMLYSFAVDGGAKATFTPATTTSIPRYSVITQVIIVTTTAVTGNAGATISFGTSAGSTSTAFIAATAFAGFVIGNMRVGYPVWATATTWQKLTAAGNMNMTIATNTLTAGIIEVWCIYFTAGG